jgi:hypothetical protein
MTAVLQTQVPLDVRSFAGLPEGGRPVGCGRIVSGHIISSENRSFGGYSGIALEDDGRTAHLVSDRGHILSLSLSYAPDGAVTDVRGGTLRRVRDSRESRRMDIEAIAPYRDGWVLAREGWEDAIFVELNDAVAVEKEKLADFTSLRPKMINRVVEAAAPVGKGLLFISESQTEEGHASILQLQGEMLSRLSPYQTAHRFAVTDAATDETTGRLFVLERAFDRLRGPRARVTVLPLAALTEPQKGVAHEPLELFRLSVLSGADNMEGLAYRLSEDGTPILLLVSDDNFNLLQRTMLMAVDLSGCDLPAAEAGARPDDEAQP